MDSTVFVTVCNFVVTVFNFLSTLVTYFFRKGSTEKPDAEDVPNEGQLEQYAHHLAIAAENELFWDDRIERLRLQVRKTLFGVSRGKARRLKNLNTKASKYSMAMRFVRNFEKNFLAT